MPWWLELGTCRWRVNVMGRFVTAERGRVLLDARHVWFVEFHVVDATISTSARQ